MKRFNVTLICILCATVSVFAQRMTDRLDRGVVAIPKSATELFVSWRFLATDPDDIAFNLYRSVNGGPEQKLNSSPLTGATNFVCSPGNLSQASVITVRPVIKGVEGDVEGYWNLKAGKAANRIVRDIDYEPLPAGYPNMMMKFCWIGDLDGDRQLDYVIDRIGGAPSESEGGVTVTTPTLLEAYTSEGVFLWRINIGLNVGTSTGHNDMVTVYDMDGDGFSEVMLCVSEGTTFPDGTVITGSDGKVRNYTGVKGSAPQWVAIVNGRTGNLLDKVPLTYFDEIATQRTDSWKDINGHFIINYLDGISPSLVYQYKNRQVSNNFTGACEAWSFKNGRLVRQYALRTTNDMADGHQVRGADVDGDGMDEFVEIGYIVEENGKVRTKAAIGHGDRHCLTDINPDRPGLEHFFIQQDNILGMGVWDAQTGEVYATNYLTAVGDVGRGICAAFDPTRRGLQYFSTMNDTRMYDCQGKEIAGAKGAFPAEALWWGPDLSRYMVSPIGSGGANIAFQRYNTSSKALERVMPNFYNEGSPYYLQAYYAGRPAFWGDILGDWREEMVMARRDTTGFAVVSTWDVTTHRQYCLFQNPGYRLQTTARGYYQSPDVDFYMAADMPEPPIAPVQTADVYLTNEKSLSASQIDGKSAMLDIRNPNSDIELSEVVAPSRLWLMNPKGHDYTIGGTGKISGAGDVVKSMQGTVYLSGEHDFAGPLRISEGSICLDGSVKAPVRLEARGVLQGDAVLNGGIQVSQGLNAYGARLEPGNGVRIGRIVVKGDLKMPGRNNLAFDIDQTCKTPCDQITVEGDFEVGGLNNTLFINAVTELLPDTLTLMTISGQNLAVAERFSVVGLEGIPFKLLFEEHTVRLVISDSREAGKVVWKGTSNALWDYQSANFLWQGNNDIFVPDDSVLFDDDHAIRSGVTVNEVMPVSALIFENNIRNYTFSGKGAIAGTGGLKKTGAGTVSMKLENSFSGPVDFSDGVLEVSSLKNGGQNSSIGKSSSAASNWIMRNATLQTAGQMSTNRNMTVVGTLTVNNPGSNHSVVLTGNIGGKGTNLVLKGQGSMNLEGKNTFDSVFVESGTLAIGSVAANSTAIGTAPITLKGGTLQMCDANNTSTIGPWTNTVIVPEGCTAAWNLPRRWNFTNKLLGGGILNLNSPYVRAELQGDWSAFTGTIKVTGQDFRLNNTYGYAKAAIDLGDKVVAYHVKSSGKTLKFGALSGVATSTLSGDNAVWEIGAAGLSTTFAGTITGSSTKLTKLGAGKLTLSGSNTYSGATTVSAGTLWVSNTSGSATGIADVNVGSSASLGGTGSIFGSVKINNNASLTMQNGGIGSLSVGKNVNLSSTSVLSADVNAAKATSDVLKVGGNLTLDGRLELTDISNTSFKTGMEFKLFDVTGIISGTFKEILPVLPESLAWDVSELNSKGVIRVTNPQNLATPKASKPISSVHYYDLCGREIRFSEVEQVVGKSLLLRKTIYQDGSVLIDKLSR